MTQASLRARRRRRGGQRFHLSVGKIMASGRRAADNLLRVELVSGCQSTLAPGGGEMQMLQLADALRWCGVECRVRPHGFDSAARSDCLHLFGSLPEHLQTVRAARRRGIPVVLSTIAWFDLASRWREAGPLRKRLRGTAGHLLRRALPRFPDWRRRLYLAVDQLLPNSQAEAQQLHRHLAIPADRITVIPNAADPRFADARPEPFISTFGLRDFILYAGRIEPRKNQLGFLRALRGLSLPILFLGDVAPGHQDYARACRREAGANVAFLPRLEHDDPLLASAYAACRCVALTSWFETPGLVALEAALSGAPLVLTRRGATREYFGELASYVDPADSKTIRKAVLEAFGRERDPRLAQHVRSRFTWRHAARATLEVYRRVV
jgi:glycosyltransferase involved in cell wall biosynthesis